jgi:hypothetical protein
MLSAIPPSITASEAVALSGHDRAPRLLEYLYRHHLFTDRRRGAEVTYHYHALFREFLLEELGRRIEPDERCAATARAGHLVSARGLQSEALALFSRRRRMEADARPSFMSTRSSGRARAARRRCRTGSRRLPASTRRQGPVAYVLVRPRMDLRRAAARPPGDRARVRAFLAVGDQRGAALALSAMVTAITTMGELPAARPLDARAQAPARRQ